MIESTVLDGANHVRRLVDQMPSMLAYWGRDLRCRFANRAYEKWYGVDPDGLIGTSLRDLLGPELFALNEPHILGALRGEPQTFERVAPGADGVCLHSLTNYQPDVVDGVAQGFIDTVTEVTALKQTEANLRSVIQSLEAEILKRRTVADNLIETQLSLAETLATSGTGIIATDREGRVTRMNKTSEQLTGWSEQEACGQMLWEVFVCEDRSPEVLAWNPVDWMTEQGLGMDMAHHVIAVSRDGVHRPVEVKAALIHAGDGTERGLAMVMRDMTPILQAEIESNRLAAIVESSQDAIVGKTLDGRITSWNAAAQAMFGYSAEEAIGRPVQMLIPEDRQSEEMHIVASLARGVRVPVFDTVRRAKDGRLIDVSITISPIRDAHGRIVGASKIARDVTERKQAEQAALKASRLEAENRQIQEANRLKSLFLANMSHELRTPLNAIIGFADLLHSGKVPQGSPKQQVFLGHIASSGRHLLQLINDVLDISKVESGKFEFFPEPVDLPTLAQEVGDIMLTMIERKAINFSIAVDPQLSGIVLDAARLKQVLYNYTSNAIKFTANGGSVTVRARPQGADHFVIEVEDTGIGIAAEQLPRLFTEFQQIDAGYARQHQGTGLGLALTRRLVEAQGGSVGVTSRPGSGSVFYAQLNRVHGTDAARSSTDDPVPANSPSHRMLVVEDDWRVQTRLSRSLSDAGFSVEAAASAQQAAHLAFDIGFDGLTLDLRLPDQSGLELLASIREGGPSRSTPVLGMTLAGGADAIASFAIADILCKPIRSDEIVAAMGRLRQAIGSPTTRVMVIDDDPLALDLMRTTLASIGIETVCFQDGRKALREIDQRGPQAIILDLMMPGFDGFAVLDALQRMPHWRDIPVFIWTSMILTDEEYATLAGSARAILSKGGGDLAVMLERLQRWRPMTEIQQGAPGND